MMITEIGPLGPALSIIAVLGVVISYLLLRREMKVELAKLKEMVAEKSTAVPVPAVEVAKQESTPAQAQAAPKAKQEPVPVAAPVNETITPEILAVISAAVAQFLGAGARIRSTRMLAPASGLNPWAQQGRVIIQASHNLGVR